ncbi:MAG TPA: phosphoglucosamine mutase [Armatimonadota bacterium]|jgi:phosphomannomutase
MPGIRTLKTGISGVRGVVGESFTPQLVSALGQAFGTYLTGGRVALGRDTRPSGEMVREALTGALLASGCRVVDLGVVPVPTLQIAISRSDNYDGGIAITASHNPQEWNALKFIRADGVFLYPYQAEELLNVFHQGDFTLVPNEEIGDLHYDDTALDLHLGLLLENIDVELIRRRRFRVVVDCCNGAGTKLAPRLLEELGCEVTVLNGEPTGHFARPPEPLPANLGALAAAVPELGADLGFAQDADADRLAVIDERGLPISEEFTVPLSAEVVAARGPLPLVTNLSASRLLEEVGRRWGCPVFRAKVGEINVVEMMQAEARAWGQAGHEPAAFGGEGNGGVIDPRLHYCRDSHRGMCLILEGLARREQKLSEWVAGFPPAAMVKLRVECPAARVQRVQLALREAYAGEGSLDETEGLRISWPDGSWLHVRPSNTEAIIRIMAEADTEPEARARGEHAQHLIEAALR